MRPLNLLLTGFATATAVFGATLAAQAGFNDDQMTRQDLNRAVADALGEYCPQNADMLTDVSCMKSGFDGNRYSCSYKLQDRFGRQHIRIRNEGMGWSAESRPDCKLPQLEISAQPKRQDLADAMRRICPSVARDIQSANCSGAFNSTVQDEYSCKFMLKGEAGFQNADIALKNRRWRLLDGGSACDQAADRSASRDYDRPAHAGYSHRDDTVGAAALSAAMRDMCPMTADALSYAACAQSGGDASEYSCAYRTHYDDRLKETMIARDGGGWSLIDMPEDCLPRG